LFVLTVPQSLRETKIMRKYFVQRREDYVKYDRMVGQVRSLCSKLKVG
jgi:U3 small nucleolar ribonucleoprotein protein IMP3